MLRPSDITVRIAKRRADMPRKYRKLYDKVMAGKTSPRDAIKMQCLECYGWVQTETKKCDNYACSLFYHRPYQKLPKSPTEPLQRPSIHKPAGKREEAG